MVLTRKREEQVFIEVPASSEPRLIKLMVVEIRGEKCRIGIDAPRDWPVHREEIYEAIKREASPDT